MKRPLRLLLALLASLLAPVIAHSNSSLSLPQADGSRLELAAPAQRLITLAPHLAELVYAVGAGDRLLATVAYSDYPAAAAELPRIGDAFRFDLERMLTLQPDLVLAWDSGTPESAIKAMEDLGMPVWRVRINSFEAMAQVLEQLAAATGQHGTTAAAQVRQRRDGLRARYGNQRPLSYFYQIGARPLYTVNGAHLISQGLAICGGVNVFADLPTLAPQLAPEAVLQADPELLLAGSSGPERDPLAQWRSWPQLQAVKHDALLTLPADLMNRATPRMLDAVEEACAAFAGWRQRTP